MMTNAMLRDIFAECNQKYFGGTIPRCDIRFMEKSTKLGEFYVSFNGWKPHIRINCDPSAVGLKVWPEWFLRETVLHEMVHAYITLVLKEHDSHPHGKIFHRVVRQLRKEHGVNTYVNPMAALHRKSWNPFTHLGDLIAGLLFRHLL